MDCHNLGHPNDHTGNRKLFTVLMEAITIKYHDLTDCRPYQIWEGELCEPPPILEILEKESWFFLTFFSCLDSKTIEGRTYLSFNFVRFSFILFCQIVQNEKRCWKEYNERTATTSTLWRS